MKGSVPAISDMKEIEDQLNYKYGHGTCNWIQARGIGKHELILQETNSFIILKTVCQVATLVLIIMQKYTQNVFQPSTSIQESPS
jgi:hypothetical protein